MNRYLAEALGTFMLVFVGTGAIVINDVSGGSVTHLGVSLAFGLVVTAMIFALGHISGAHMNPAVTVGLSLSRHLPKSEIFPYIVSQSVGAVIASFALRALASDHQTLGATLPSGSFLQSFWVEILLTFILMLVILVVVTATRQSRWLSSIVIGGTVAGCALFAGPISGASMNPARSLGPALAAGLLSTLWIYLAAPLLGAALAVVGCKVVRGRDCCAGS